MRVEGYNEDYRIKEFRAKSHNTHTELSWRFKEASHFLIFIYDSRYEFDPKPTIEQLKKEGITDQMVVNSRSKDNIYERENGKFKLFCLREKEFVQDKKTYIIPSQKLKKGIPYEISVFACDYDSGELTVFLPKDKKENLQYIPVVIQPEIRYEKKLFSKNTTCILKLPSLEDYKDGAIMYHVENVRADFPLSAGCLGRELYISVPGKDTVAVRIREEYKKYYKKA